MSAATRRHSAPSSSSSEHLGQPRGILSPRVRAAGPEHFGVVSIDCAKASSKWMLNDFYGRVLIAPAVLDHRRDAFDHATAQIRQAMTVHGLKDLVVVVERTGRYHLPVKRAFAAAGFEVRLVHPMISRHFRRAAHPDQKTDDTDLEGIFQAGCNGYGMREEPWEAVYRQLQLWARHRRDLVQKSTLLCCQILEHLESCLPGYTRCFDNVFNSRIAFLIAGSYQSPQAILEAGITALTELARRSGVRAHQPTLIRVLAWAQDASHPDEDAPLHQRLLGQLNQDRITKEEHIQSIEGEMVNLLVQTPYVRLLALPGINVVLAAELSGELGPITHYATGRVITGRAGLYPRRYQSGPVDYRRGRLARQGNRRLRQVLLIAAETLCRCNNHFRVLQEKWRVQGKDPRDIYVRVAGRLARITLQMVAGSQAFRHPACQGPPAVLSKLMEFHNKHNINLTTTRTNLQRAAVGLPGAEQAREREAWEAKRAEIRGKRGRGPKRLAAILPAVLRQLVGGELAGVIQSQASGETP
jgi:transposase